MVLGSKSGLLTSTSLFPVDGSITTTAPLLSPNALMQCSEDWHSVDTTVSPVFFSLRTDSSSASEKKEWEVRRVSSPLIPDRFFHWYHNPQHGRTYWNMDNYVSQFHPHLHWSAPKSVRQKTGSYLVLHGRKRNPVWYCKGC